ncbi:MAG: hypothetical protein DHS20C20_08440 [Ardenticatenaceae bacterium]|nr:MAG: hypothetical protein DHS20C20_08440 [Ardenticatenaceae bacterium]
MHLKRFTVAFFFVFMLFAFSACAADVLTESTPIPPPPNADNDVGSDEVAVSTLEPSPLPEDTAVQPTPTLFPSATPTAEAPPTAVADSATQAEPLPATSRDLLFLADGAFKQWNHATSQIETIVAGATSTNPTPDNPDKPTIGSITAYAMNADGKRAVVARVTNSTNAPDVQNAPAEYGYELLFVDMISREVWTLVPQVDNLQGFELSPDAQQLAFIGSGLNGNPDAVSNEPIPTNLYVMETGGGNPANLRTVHRCQRLCSSPEWHIENNLMVFGDDDALWLYNIAAAEPERLFDNNPFNSDMTDVGEVSVYWPETWARNGRTLMLWHGGWEWGSRALYDLPTGVLLEIPNSLIFADIFPTQVSWMPDDRILVWRTDFSEEAFIPLVALWRFDVGSGELILEETAQLSHENLGVMGGIHLEDGRFAFALDAAPLGSEAEQLQAPQGIYQLTSLAEQPERVNSLPPNEGGSRQVTVLWAADGSGALLLQSDRPTQPLLYYAPADSNILYEVTAVFGQNPRAFQWQPEIILP